MMTPGGQYRQNTMPQVYRNYIDGGAGGGAGGQQRRFKNLEDIVCFKVGPKMKLIFGCGLNDKYKSPPLRFVFGNFKLKYNCDLL